VSAPATQPPALRQLLHALVDRLDAAEARGSGRAQSVALSSQLWPAFYEQPFESDREALWEEVRDLAKSGLIAITPEKAARSASGYDMSARISVCDSAALRLAVNRLTRSRSAPERWRDAVAAHLDVPAERKKAAGAYCIELPGHEAEDVVRQLNGLADLAESGMLLREVSSTLFWGMSKVLDDRQGLVAAVLGVDECPFPEAAVQLHVVLPHADPRHVLFIENQMTFEKAARSNNAAYQHTALVFASGFKATAKRLRSPGGASLFYGRAGSLHPSNVAAFEDWLFGSSTLATSFWGDLDWSGMRILRTLRESFPDLRAWEPGYAAMLEHVLAGRGHSPAAAEKRGQVPVSRTGCEYADSRLLPALSKHGFVDQELFNP
jgi:hypothetical protein